MEGRAPIVLQRKNEARGRAGIGPEFPEPVRDMLPPCEGRFLLGHQGDFFLKQFIPGLVFPNRNVIVL